MTFLRTIHLMCNPDVGAFSPVMIKLHSRNNFYVEYGSDLKIDLTYLP